MLQRFKTLLVVESMFVSFAIPACGNSGEKDGCPIWVVSAGGVEMDEGMAIATYDDGSSVVSGGIQCNAVFGKGEENEITLPAIYCGVLAELDVEELFVAKYNPCGKLSWAFHVGGSIFFLAAFMQCLMGLYYLPAALGEAQSLVKAKRMRPV